LLPDVDVGTASAVIGVPLGAETACSSLLSGIGIAAAKLAKRAVATKGRKKTIVEK